MWLWACVVPHPPILVPDVGKGREREAAVTLEGFRSLARELEGDEPEVLVVLSPHAPRRRGFTILAGPRYLGNLGTFGAPRISLEYTGASEWSWMHDLLSGRLPVSVLQSEEVPLDHGALVPLAMLQPSLRSSRLILANPSGLTHQDALQAGRLLRQFPPGGRWALVASGDLSHRLAADGPYGLHPDGAVFDRAVCEALKTATPAPVQALSEQIIDNAGQCGLQSLMIFLGLTGGDPVALHSYEAPFGVGYATASWRNLPIPVFLARENLKMLLSTDRAMDVTDARKRFAGNLLWGKSRGCFVTLKTRQGRLRGCIGTLSPVTPSLGEEILRNSVLAARGDPRFPPVVKEEWGSLSVSVDVLGPLERVETEAALDPVKWGVVVVRGDRKGVLLPDLPGVDTVARQVAIAREKAGIAAGLECQLFRFAVMRYQEGAEGP